jgi:murein L,D-transpeptidase YafK
VLPFPARLLRFRPLEGNDFATIGTSRRGRPPAGSFVLSRSPFARSILVSLAFVAAVALAGCNTDGVVPTNAKAMAPLSSKTLAEIEKKNMDKDSPILVRIFKEESELEVWKQDRAGRFALLKTYPICRWSGELGPKTREGDRQAPEGFYTITPTQMNPNSAYYLSFDLGYPNAYDRSYGRTGAQLMVHGDCSSAGCYSMTDEQIAEIYALGREAFFGGQRSFQVQAYPFHMTAANFARHRTNPNIPFWKMLKEGNDHFEVSKQEPKVNVCERRYVFDAQNPADPSKPLSFNASAKCPDFSVPSEIEAGVRAKDRRDEAQIAELSAKGGPVAPIKTNADGGMHPVFAEAVKRHEVGMAPNSYMLASVPGTIPAHVQPPRAPEFNGAPEPVVAVEPAPQPVRTAAAQPNAAPTSSTAGSLFGGLFSGSSEQKSGGPLDRMAKIIGLRGSDPAPVAAETPKPKVASHATHRRALGAIRPKPAEAEPVRTAAAAAPPAAPAQQQPAPALAGAAPTVPAGSFSSRWLGFN